MSRPAIAFIVAPFWVPLVVGSLTAVPPVSDTLPTYWWALTGLVSWFFAYLGAFALGVPAFLFFLRARGMTALWFSAVLGFVAGAITWAIFWVCLVQFLGVKLRGAEGAVVEALKFHGMLFSAAGLLGLLVGVTIWLIARPDRSTLVDGINRTDLPKRAALRTEAPQGQPVS
jgi:hypothetical protein